MADVTQVAPGFIKNVTIDNRETTNPGLTRHQGQGRTLRRTVDQVPIPTTDSAVDNKSILYVNSSSLFFS